MYPECHVNFAFKSLAWGWDPDMINAGLEIRWGQLVEYSFFSRNGHYNV